jgi:hypothetical protein
VLIPAPRPSLFFPVKYPFLDLRRRKFLHIRVPAGFVGPGWGKLGSEISLGLKGFGCRWARGFSPVFWQTERYSGIFSTRTEKNGFSGFSIEPVKTGERIGARLGLILLILSTGDIHGCHVGD